MDFLTRCRWKKCQFRHTVDDNDITTGDTEADVTSDEESECNLCPNINMQNEKTPVFHTEDRIQNYSACDFKTNCETEYNTHWNSTSGHNFNKMQMEKMSV